MTDGDVSNNRMLFDMINRRHIPFNFRGCNFRGFQVRKNLIQIRMFIKCSHNKDLFNIDCLYHDRSCIVDFICTDFKLIKYSLVGNSYNFGSPLKININGNGYSFISESKWSKLSFILELEASNVIWKPILIMNESSCWGNEEDEMALMERSEGYYE